MYNKLFTKILDSSIWLTPDPHRLVWITLLAAMDEDGFVQFASVANLAYRARVSPDDCQSAVDAFESPDPNSGDPDNEGRRIEKIPGGWIVLNARKYRDIVSREVQKENTRARVAAHRAKKRNADVTPGNGQVTPSEASTSTDTKTSEPASPHTKPKRSPRARTQIATDLKPDDRMTSYALDRLSDMDVEATFRDFRDYHLAKGDVAADWGASWRTWVNNCWKGFAYVRRDVGETDAPRQTPAEWRAEQEAKRKAESGGALHASMERGTRGVS